MCTALLVSPEENFVRSLPGGRFDIIHPVMLETEVKFHTGAYDAAKGAQFEDHQ